MRSSKEDSTGYVPLVGAGINYQAWSGGLFDVTLFAAFHYVTEIKYNNEFYAERDSAGVLWESPQGTQKGKYYELAGGVTVSKDLAVGRGITLQPYGGVQLSRLDGDEVYDHNYVLIPGLGHEHREGKIKDDGMVALFAGAGAFLSNGLGVRLEGRFVNQTSISLGALYNF
ncbi:MAG: hypothetical protein NTV49_06795 [Kiritimatiellaeota bacterium]|nr:hypothetical protein [Kiritimatiellota bacterium]